MAAINPFDGAHRAELRSVARFALTGKRIPAEYAVAAQRWAYVIDLFLMCFDRSAGVLVHLPAAGGVLDQGYTTMQAFGVLEDVWEEERRKVVKRGRRGKA